MASISPTLTADSVGINRPGAKQAALRFMPKAKPQRVFGMNENTDASGQIKAAARIQSKNLPESDAMGYLDTPDGGSWYYVGQFSKNGEGSINRFSFTIYDQQFNEVATIEDDVTLGENETRIVDVQLGGLVTKKFFNNDDQPEFMVTIVANTPEYVNHNYTKVYSAGAAESVIRIEGYWVADVNTATDSWSENFWLGFLTEQETLTPQIGGVANSTDYVIDIYKKAGYSSACESVQQIRIPTILSSGEAYIPILACTHNGNAYFAANYLKYSFYENPYDWNNENLTSDNYLVVDIYEMPRYGDPSLSYQTHIPVVGSTSDMNFYYLGAFMYDGDITFGRYTEDNTPSLTITRAHYETSSDDYSYSYYIYPAGSAENPVTTRIITLGENLDEARLMSDVRGCDPQVCFVKQNGDNYTFDFVNLLNGEVECTLPYQIADGIKMNANVDRVANGGSSLYVVAQNTAEADEEGNAINLVAYVNPDGSLHHADRLNLGQDVAYANIFSSAYALDPYIFNTDADREYMALVKRYINYPVSTATREELMVISPSKGTLLNLLPDAELGNLLFVQLDDQSEYGQNLLVVYRTSEYRLNTVRYELPFDKFAGGDGSAENPYQIATLGDLRQIKFNLSANYVMVNDIDARDVEMEHVTGSFTGTFDGGGHNIIGPNLDGQGLFTTVIGSDESINGVVKNLNIVQPSVVVADYSTTGILADNATMAKISNVFIYDATVEGATPDVSATFGGIVGSAALYSEISGSAIIGANINLPESAVGGIVGSLKTSSTIKVCSFKGDITGGKSVGGVVGNSFGQTTSGCSIEDCHVDAAIVAKNTVGGVIGSSARDAIARCHVQGSIAATEAPMWGGGPATGGLIGELSTDWSGSDTEVKIKSNFINLSSLTAFATTDEPAYDGDGDTFHRVVGASCANEMPDPIYDDNWNIIGYGDPLVETILGDNYVIDTLPRSNENIADDAATTEGKSIAKAELSKEFFEGLGYAFGYEIDAPWNEMSPESPRLYFEKPLIMFDQAEYEVDVDSEIGLTISLFGERIDDDTLSGFSVDISDESIVEYVNFSAVEGEMVFTVKGLKAGSTTVTANYNGQTAQATVIVNESSGISNVKTDASVLIEYRGGVVAAESCMIEVYSIAGAKVLDGTGACDLSGLAKGVYVISVTDKSGRQTSTKVMR